MWKSKTQRKTNPLFKEVLIRQCLSLETCFHNFSSFLLLSELIPVLLNTEVSVYYLADREQTFFCWLFMQVYGAFMFSYTVRRLYMLTTRPVRKFTDLPYVICELVLLKAQTSRALLHSQFVVSFKVSISTIRLRLLIC